MSGANATGIDATQVEFLATQTDLGLEKEVIWKILNFEMPTFEQVEEYDKQFEKDPFTDCVYDIQLAYRYYEGHSLRLQRRAIRYLNLCLAMQHQIPVEEGSQVALDLAEVDINLEDEGSGQSGWERVSKALRNTAKEFLEYAEQATDLSTYGETYLPMGWWFMHNDDERFGPEDLCFKDYLDWLHGTHLIGNWMVELTEKQKEELESKHHKKFRNMCEALTDKIDDLLLGMTPQPDKTDE